MSFSTLVLWVYIVLLFLGGLVGYLKAGSKISLIMSACFAGVLILCNTEPIVQRPLARAYGGRARETPRLKLRGAYLRKFFTRQ